MHDTEMPGEGFIFAAQTGASTAAAARRTADAALVDRVCAGDEEAFGEFYRKFAPMVHGIALARVPREDVEDIVQDVFVSAFNSIVSLKNHAAPGAWLAAITRNRAAEHYRRTRPTEELTEDIRQSPAPRAEASEILAAIRALPEAYTETLVLRLVEGMTGPEIAERTGLTPESVRVNLHRGMKMLRQKLGIWE